MVVTSFAGAKLAGTVLEKLVAHLPASWRAKAAELVGRLIHRRGPLDDDGMRGPLRAGAAEGRGWKWVADTNPDPLYGQPRADHGTGLNPDSQVPNTVDPEVARIGGNAAHPWGNNPATGEPLTEAQWTARYVLPNGSVRWPPNAGAVPGTRVVFDDADKFVEIYGDQFDRVGGPAGYYLGIPPGTPFVERALPPGLLEMRMHEYVFTGELPPGVTIEISEIAPAFGQPGGGLQVQFMDGASPIRIEDLIDGTYQGALR